LIPFRGSGHKVVKLGLHNFKRNKAMLFPEVQAVCQASRLHIILASERKSRSLNACDGRNKTKQDS